ncbi:Hypothetical predicted protein [Marmota monax]|uniref:Uncharacterized protein n=1 Tax=Marmota monax TaxID=9995 RepID=A0A5E4AUD8_MARMO|nr:Hypothetical predicted protein [Marmota monax]
MAQRTFCPGIFLRRLLGKPRRAGPLCVHLPGFEDQIWRLLTKDLRKVEEHVIPCHETPLQAQDMHSVPPANRTCIPSLPPVPSAGG